MTSSQVHVLVVAGVATCWGTIGIAWVVGALVNASRGPQEQTRRQLGSTAVVGAVLVWVILKIVPAHDWHGLVVQTPWVRVPGLVVLAGSAAFTFWARVALGRMWSSAPMVKEEHELRTGGPYTITRHPIYTGLLGMLFGTVLLVGFGRWIVIFPVALVLIPFKIRAEEALMLSTFPVEYSQYRRRVPQLVPGLRLFRAGRR